LLIFYILYISRESYFIPAVMTGDYQMGFWPSL